MCAGYPSNWLRTKVWVAADADFLLEEDLLRYGMSCSSVIRIPVMKRLAVGQDAFESIETEAGFTVRLYERRDLLSRRRLSRSEIATLVVERLHGCDEIRSPIVAAVQEIAATWLWDPILDQD